MEMGAVQESLRAVQRSTETILEQPCSPKTPSPRRSELYGFRASLRKVRLCHGMNESCTEFEDCKAIQCARNDEAEYNHPFDTDSLADDNEQDIDEMSNQDSELKLSVNYNTLPYANFVGESYSNTQDGIEDESWIHYPNHSLKVESSCVEYFTATGNDQYSSKNSKGRILSWRTKKLRFNSSKPKTKGEPLLKKGYGDEGGDDIDFDRRHLSSCDESTLGWNTSEEGSITSRSSFSEFGDDNFTVGSWEHKEIISRDGMMKLQVEVFFASIDQRSERAAGESACTTLVAVIANWLQSSQYDVPNKSEFDSLIRDGSLEWRNLCENESYIQQFPDKHFDLETVLQAKIRPLSVASDKSFIGFFQPEGLEGGNFDFLNDAMSFDSIWDEIRRHGSEWDSNSAPLVYIVSWNDHFFILKVTNDAYYIIDTLGERLYEGCNEAYVLKFDKDTTIQRLPKKVKASDEKSINDKVKPSNLKEKGSPKGTREFTPNEVDKTRMEEEVVFKGRESCKEYIKSFMAAIPIRELKADIKKGLMTSTPLHQRLQIEFHYTHLAHILIE
ncbi:hypothetical protein K2173_025052 [Erythroxylum novogranatense]|uniref:Uncharacterized protein n=1 Tax=Erythroxylum novogranatense TaxID=1862640 RepID=A0AAV8SWG0_9ROSI|nr:hypothetical protein K2173_025052 [Erythroxylum novogranatense]